MARAGGGRSGGGSFGGGGRSSFGGGSRSGGGRSSFGGGGRSGGGSIFGGSSNSRSAGGSFGGSSGGGGFFSGSSRSNHGGGGLFGGGFGRNSRPNNNVIINNMNNNRFGGSHTTYGGSAGNGGNQNPGGGGARPGGCSKGCLIAVVAVLAFMIITALIVASMGGASDSDITVSTIQREPLPAGSVTETDYYTDELDWIGNETKLLKGLKNFYKATGVQPYLYITDNVNGASISHVDELEAYARELYPRLFSDEAHLLFIFYERDGEYADYYLCGAQAKTVIDREAGDILLDYVDRYYYSDMGDEEFFSKAFDDAAARIMTVEKSPWPMVWIAFGIAAIILILFLFWRERVKQKNRKAEQDAKILETPLERFGDVEVDELEKKYRDKDQDNKDEF